MPNIDDERDIDGMRADAQRIIADAEQLLADLEGVDGAEVAAAAGHVNGGLAQLRAAEHWLGVRADHEAAEREVGG
jgi:hypothetical protein